MDYGKLIHVHRGLCELIEEEVTGFNVLDLCQVFSLWHEYFLLHDTMRWGPAALVTQSLRALIELAVKSCDLSGFQADEKDCDYMLALAQLVVGWDSVWDQFSTELFPQEIVIGEDHSFKSSADSTAFQSDAELYAIRI